MSTSPVTKSVKTPPLAPPSEDQSKFEYVTVPEADTVFDHPYPTIWINRERYEAGQTYFVEPDIAKELRRIIKTYEASMLRILQPKKDASALKNLRDTRGHQGQDLGTNQRD